MFKQKDKLVWHFERNDGYTVKSEYHIARQIRRITSKSNSADLCPNSLYIIEVFWRKTWSINLSSKLSIFLWSMLSEKLLTNLAIHKRIYEVASDCALCGVPESCKHIFLDYPRAVAIWINSPIPIWSTLLRGNCFHDCWEKNYSMF